MAFHGRLQSSGGAGVAAQDLIELPYEAAVAAAVAVTAFGQGSDLNFFRGFSEGLYFDDVAASSRTTSPSVPKNLIILPPPAVNAVMVSVALTPFSNVMETC